MRFVQASIIQLKLGIALSGLLLINNHLYGAEGVDSNPVIERPQAPSSLFDPHTIKDSDRFWIDAEVLFWQASLDNLNYAITSDHVDSLSHSRIHEPHFDWNWGGRLGLGYKLPYDQWDLFANYTYVHAHAHGDESKHNGAVFPTWEAPFAAMLAPGDTLYATQAHAHWDAHVNIVDLELGRSCFAGKWLSFRPFMGVRGLFIDQEYQVSYKGGTAAPAGDIDQVSMHNDFWGAGLRIGCDSLWGLGKGWSIYGDGAASLLSGHFHVDQKERLKKSNTQKIGLSNHVDHVVVNAELALGVQWDYLFSKDRYHVGVKFGWEFNVFFDQNQLIRFVDDSLPGAIVGNDGDLSFQGLTLGFRFDF